MPSRLFSFIMNYLPLIFSLCFITTFGNKTFGVVKTAMRSEETDHPPALLDIESKIHSSGSQYKGFLESRNDLVHEGVTYDRSQGAERREEMDRLALLDFKSKIYGSGLNYTQFLKSWNDSIHHCNWEGIICGRRHRRVTVLDLSGKGLSGSLSPVIGNLSFLQVLRITQNNFHGQIPPEIGRLSRLHIFLVGHNSLEGEIPMNLSHCHNLKYLSLSTNKLHGNIPPEFSSFIGLKRLILQDNRLTGTIDVLGNLTSLELLSISNNDFQGRFPSIIGRLKLLTTLYTEANSFTGQFPSSIYNLSLLVGLTIGSKLIHGSLPPNLGLTLPHLRLLRIAHCQFEGPIPTSLSNLSNIEIIEIQYTSFSGKIRLNGQNLPNLSLLEFAVNPLLGTRGDGDLDFLNSLVNCSRLSFINLSANQLGGTMPPSVANLSTNLMVLELPINLISGNIPLGLNKLVNLQLLSLYSNRFTGSIPNDIGMLKMLSVMYLKDNDFSGSIPTSFGNLSQLISLVLSDNQLQGAIPSSLGNLISLQSLDLESNRLSGEIPPHLFHASNIAEGLFLHGNRLQGTLPVQIGQLQHAAELDLSNNKLSGNIPESLGQCKSLIELHMNDNSFTGSIPESLSSLKGLLDLDLSRNNLSGQIPSYLANFALKSLNLSFNNFEGEVPMKRVFANASAVSIEGNERLCGGIPQLHLPACLGSSQSKEKKILLIILLPSISSLLVGVTVVLLLFNFFLKSKCKNNTSTLSQERASCFLRVSYNMLLDATDEFSLRNLIGMGGFGSVYHGILNIDEKTMPIAVKVLNLQHQGSADSFMRECKALRNIRHRNLVGIISACSSIDFQGNDFKALVYEFMLKGNLDQWLHSNPVVDNEQVNEIDSNGPQSLKLLRRINIVIDVAYALDYLHHDCETSIVHCDLKPSNILLDNDMVAHVGDFGLARLLPKEIISQSLSSGAGLQGTIGYAPPEYGLGNQISTRGDVYSYGIVLLEMMTAKKPTDQIFQNPLNLHNYAKIAIPDNVMDILDPMLLEADETIADVKRYTRVGDYRKMESLVAVIKVGVECSVDSPQDRMTIKDALKELNTAKDMLMGTRRV